MDPDPQRSDPWPKSYNPTGSGRTTTLDLANALCRRLHQERPLAALNVTERITAELLQLLNKQGCVLTTGCRSPPPFSRRGKAGRNHLKSFGIGERFSQTISNLWHAALLRRCELPLKTKVLN